MQEKQLRASCEVLQQPSVPQAAASSTPEGPGFRGNNGLQSATNLATISCMIVITRCYMKSSGSSVTVTMQQLEDHCYTTAAAGCCSTYASDPQDSAVSQSLHSGHLLDTKPGM